MLHELPMWLIETRVKTEDDTARWMVLMDAGLLSLDDVTFLLDEMSEVKNSLLEYRARLHPKFGTEVIYGSFTQEISA